MGLKRVLRLKQKSPSDVRLGIDYDKWPARDSDGGQVFVHYVGADISDDVANGNVTAEHAQLRSIESYHVSKGWRGIGYDWAVGNSGTLYRLRGKARSASTSGDVDGDGEPNNSEGDGVLVLLGPGDSFSQDAQDTLFKVLEAFNRPVYTHREAKGIITNCPGEILQRWVQRYRSGNLRQQREHRAVAVTARREPDQGWARMLAHAHAFAYVEQSIPDWMQVYPDGHTLKVNDIDYLVAVGHDAQNLVSGVGDGVAIVGATSDETRLKIIELIRDTDVNRQRPWSE